MEEPKDTVATPHVTPVLSPHVTQVPSPHQSPSTPMNVTLLQAGGSPVQIVDLGDGESSSRESSESDGVAKKTTEAKQSQGSPKLAPQAPKNPFATSTVVATAPKKKMFSIDSLGVASQVISTKSWLEDTLERKRRRKDESTLVKDAISLAIQSSSAIARAKKQKPLSILGHDRATGHLNMEVANPNKEGRMEDMMIDDFTLHSIDLGEARHDTKVGLWKSTNEVIEEQLKSLKSSKVRMKSEIKKLNKFIRQLLSPLAAISGMTVTRNPNSTEVQTVISQLQEDRHFGQIGKEWIEKIRMDGSMVIEQIGSNILRLEQEKDNILTNNSTLTRERAKSDKCGVLLKMILQMKGKEAMEAKILSMGSEPLAEWLKSISFRSEMILSAEK